MNKAQRAEFQPKKIDHPTLAKKGRAGQERSTGTKRTIYHGDVSQKGLTGKELKKKKGTKLKGELPRGKTASSTSSSVSRRGINQHNNVILQ